MAMTMVSGKVSNFSQETVITGTQQGRTGAGVVHSDKEISFRIDNKPTVLKLKESVDLSDGEQVTVVGKDKKGVFRGIALKNNATGVIYALKTWPIVVLGVVLTLLSLPLIGVIIGIFFLPIGIWLLHKAYLNIRALSMLQAA